MSMDSIEKLNTAITMVEEARSVPLSASCVVHRGEILEILEGAREYLPSDLHAAEQIIADRDRIIEEGLETNERLVLSLKQRESSMMRATLLRKSEKRLRPILMADSPLLK